MIAFSPRRAVALAGSLLLSASAGYVAAPAAQASSQPSWSILKLLNMKRYADLLTAAAPAPNDAWTFGQVGGTGKPVAVHWDGSTWAGSRIPGALARSGSVSATSPRNVWSSGSACAGGPPGPSVSVAFVSRYNGRTWTTKKWDTSAFCGASVVTTGPRNGWLLGHKQALHFAGKRWHKVSLPVLAQTIAATATSAKDIWTVGATTPRTLSKTKAFFDHYNGRVWRRVSMPAIPVPKNGYLYPYDIEAASANSVWASVTVERAGADSFLLHWNGHTWQSIPAPATPDQLLRVVPDGQGGVWAILFQTDSGNYQFAHYSNGNWTFDPIPTSGLPGYVAGSATFDIYAMTRIPGTSSLLATGDVYYTDSSNVQRQYSVVFRYGP